MSNKNQTTEGILLDFMELIRMTVNLEPPYHRMQEKRVFFELL